MLNLKSKNQNLNLKTNVKYRAYQFSLAIVSLVKTFPSNKIFQIFTDQLLRAATSIGANIIEAKASSSKKDFIKFYQIALKSANETTYWLSLLKDSGLVSEDKIDSIYRELIEISKMLGSSLLTLKGRRSSF